MRRLSVAMSGLQIIKHFSQITNIINKSKLSHRAKTPDEKKGIIVKNPENALYVQTFSGKICYLPSHMMDVGHINYICDKNAIQPNTHDLCMSQI